MDAAVWYRWFAENEAAGSSPRYERLAQAVADDDDLLKWLGRLPAAKRQPNLLFATVRYLGGPTGSVEEFVEFVRDNASAVEATMSTRATQTNEAARCAAFVPVLAEMHGEVALIEVGASAGLCLFLDRYAYRYDGGERLGDSRLEIRVDTAHTVKAPQRLPEVSWRAGLDLDPLDVSDADDLSWLQACVWPEHEKRRHRLDLAVEIVGADPPRIDRGDLRDATRALIDDAPRNATKVVFHSAVLAYVDEPSRRAFCTAMRHLVEERDDVVWLSNEGPTAVADLDVSASPEPPPVAGAHFHLGHNGTELVALTDSHGRWLRWANST
ncbi:MAG: DUF2332 domain-containing protein [Actinomycetota bacterium]